VGTAAELEASLREFAARGVVEVRENGSRLAPLSKLFWEVRGSGEKPLIHLWSEHYNVTRRVLAITDNSDQRLALAIERFGCSKPDRMEFVLVDFERDSRGLSREQFCDRMKNLLAEQFPDETLESLTTSSDLEHSLSGNYVRGLLRRDSTATALLAVSDGESSETVEGSLTFGLLWLERLRERVARGTVDGLRLVVPSRAAKMIRHVCGALKPGFRIELFEHDSVREIFHPVDLSRAGNLETRVVSRQESERLLERARPALNPILSIHPDAMSLHASTQSEEVWVRFRGLTVACWNPNRVSLFFGKATEGLCESSLPKFKKLLHDLEVHRHPLASDTRHPLYRPQPERWLEYIVSKDVIRIDAGLDPRLVYEQVLVNAGGEHGIIDLLAVTRSGRLAIIELKNSEHIHLPIQAAGYWLFIRRHLEQGNFQRCGYFPGIELQTAPPIVYLVAPAMRFHPSTDTLLRYFHPKLEVIQVGLAENWRRGLRVVLRR